MSVIGLILAATMVSAPASNGNVTISTADANEWVGIHLEVRGWSKDEVAVREDPSNHDVHGKIEQVGGSTKVMATYTGPRTTGFLGFVHWGNGRGARLTVYVPENKALTVQNRNGAIEIHDVLAPIVADTANGGISVDGAGPSVHLKTANGALSIAIRSLNGGSLDVVGETHNGGIDLTVPPGTSARVEASTSNGRISNHLPTGGRSLVKLRTSNGGISIGPG